VPGGALDSSPNAPTSDGRFGNSITWPDEFSTPNVGLPATAAGMTPMRYLSSRFVPAPGSSPFDAGAEAVSFVSTNPLVPYQPALQPRSASAAQPKSVHVLTSRFDRLNPGGVTQGGASTSGISPRSAQNGWPPAPAEPASARVSNAPTAVGLRPAGSRRRSHGRLVQPLDQAAFRSVMADTVLSWRSDSRLRSARCNRGKRPFCSSQRSAVSALVDEFVSDIVDWI
jgi:hypothetical protein